MLYEDFSAKIVGMQDVEIENFYEKKERLHVHCKIKRKKNKCPCCRKETDKVHDYREQTIKDAPVHGKVFLIHLKRRRYRCNCGKIFYEKNEAIHRYQRMTHRLKEYVVEKLREERSFTSKLAFDIFPKCYEYYLSD